ncbi:helix-turn-helix domain-containing protein [Myxococcaceae bacterium GXIMD 01537]
MHRLELKQADEEALARLTRRGRESVRVLKRARVLQLLHEGWTMVGAAKAAGVAENTARLVRRRYMEEGLQASLHERPRPGRERRFTPRQASEVVALVCSSPPEGHARWTMRLLVSEVVRRGIGPRVGKETMRELLLRHDLKPWREKNVVCAQAGRPVRAADGGRTDSLREALQPA